MEETNHLMYLVKEFNLRFPVIHDRYEMVPRTLEELKQRYYQVNRLLLNARNVTKDPAQKEVIASYSFDIVKENARKANLVLLTQRTPELAKEEEHLMYELKRIEGERERWGVDRDRLYKIMSHNAEAAQIYSEKSASLKKKKHQFKKKEDGIFWLTRRFDAFGWGSIILFETFTSETVTPG